MNKNVIRRVVAAPLCGTCLVLPFCYLIGQGCETSSNRAARQWPNPPTIISHSSLIRNGFAMPPEEGGADYALSPDSPCPAPLKGFERNQAWQGVNQQMEVRIVNGLMVGAPDYVVKVGPVWGARRQKYAAQLLFDYPVPETYSTLTLSARAKESGLRLAVGLLYDRLAVDANARPEYGDYAVYESAPVDVPASWKHGYRFDLRQLDVWRLEGEDIYTRNLPPLPLRGMQLIIYGENDHNSVVVDRIAFQ